MKLERIERKDVESIVLADGTEIGLSPGQFWFEMPKSWELWQVLPGPIRRVKTWSRKRVMWVIPADAEVRYS